MSEGKIEPKSRESLTSKDESQEGEDVAAKKVAKKLRFVPLVTVIILSVIALIILAISVTVTYKTSKISKSLLPVCKNGYFYTLEITEFQGDNSNYEIEILKELGEQIHTMKSIGVHSVILKPRVFLMPRPGMNSGIHKVFIGFIKSCRKVGIGVIADVHDDERNLSGYYTNIGIQGFLYEVMSYENLNYSIDSIKFWGEAIHNAEFAVQGKMTVRYTAEEELRKPFVELIKLNAQYIDYLMLDVDVTDKDTAYLLNMTELIWTSGTKYPDRVLHPNSINRTKSDLDIILSAFLGSTNIQSQQETYKEYRGNFSGMFRNLSESEGMTLKLMDRLKRMKDTIIEFNNLGSLKETSLPTYVEREFSLTVLYKRVVSERSFYKAIYFMRNLAKPEQALTYDLNTYFTGKEFYKLFSFPLPEKPQVPTRMEPIITLNYGEAIIFAETIA